jgi:VWFA-related protein
MKMSLALETWCVILIRGQAVSTTMSRNHFVAVALCFLGSVASVLGGQTTAPPQAPATPFRSSVDVVRLDVSVLDKNREPVRGLTAADFEVRADGRVQPIVAFTAVELPDVDLSAAAWTREVATDVASNRFVAQRTFVVVLDDFNTPVDPWAAEAARRIARDVVQGMGPNDLTAVVYTFNRSNGQEFTADRSRLLGAIGRFKPVGRFASLSAQASNPNLASEAGPQSRTSISFPASPAACPGGSCVTNALMNVAEILHGAAEGRKTIVLVSPGLRLMSPETSAFDQGEAMTRAVLAMQEANVNVYQIDPRGLETRARLPEEQIETFAAWTGGRAVSGTNSPWALVPQIFRENSSYYLLGVVPTTSTTDGLFHRLNVRVTRPDVEVRTRSGYVAASLKQRKGAAPMSPLDAAIARGLPQGDIPVDLAVAPFAAPGKGGATLRIVAGFDVTPALASAGTVETIATAFREDWKSAGAIKSRIQIPATSSGVTGHLDVPSQLNLPPGRYEIRFAIESTATKRTGSVYASVTVPNFAKDRLSLSGVVLERTLQTGSGGATTSRVFDASERVTAFVKVYQGASDKLAPVQLTFQVVDAEDHVAFAESRVLSGADFADRAADGRVALPLATLPSGRYLLAVEAKADGSPVTRNVRFDIR